MKLADIDALKQTFCAECDHSIKCEDCDIDYHFEHLAPTVDAVEVVRCKDCRWFENDGYHTNCQIMQFCVETEDYCSRGERREDGNEPKSV